MIEIKNGDWVLLEHSYLYDTFVVRQVASFTKAQCQLVKHERDGETVTERRSRKSIKGVFAGENAAKSAKVALKALYEKRLAEEKALKLRFLAETMALLDPQ